VHIEWDTTALATPLGQLPFFIEYLKQGGLFNDWVGDCPLSFTSPNAPRKRDMLGTLLLSVLAGHRRYAPPHCAAMRSTRRCSASKVVSEDALRRALAKIDETAGGAVVARASRLWRPAAARGAVGSRCRCHDQAALRPSGGRGGRLQSAQNGAAAVGSGYPPSLEQTAKGTMRRSQTLPPSPPER
jgi:hypothetical protein